MVVFSILRNTDGWTHEVAFFMTPSLGICPKIFGSWVFIVKERDPYTLP